MTGGGEAPEDRTDRWPSPFLLLALMLVPALAFRSCWPMDEVRYLEVMREMLRSGDWLRLTLEGQPYTQKTPLLFWQVLVLGKLTGLDLAGRLVPALHAVAAVAAVRSLALSVTGDPGAARRAAAYAAVSPGTFFLGQSFLFDMPLAAYALGTVAIAARALLRGLTVPLSAWLLLGLALFMKGPVALLHTLPTIATIAVWRGGWRALVPTPRWIVAAACAVLPLVVYVVVCAATDPLGFAHGLEPFVQQVSGRLAGSLGHDRAWWLYVPALALFTFPWPFATRPRWAGTGLAGRLALLAVALILVFTAMPTRAVQYVFPEALLLLPWVGVCPLPGGRAFAWPVRVLAGLAIVTALSVLVGLADAWLAGVAGKGAVLAADLAEARRWPMLVALVPLAVAAFARATLPMRVALFTAAVGFGLCPTLDPMQHPEKSLPLLREHLRNGGTLVQFKRQFDGNFLFYLDTKEIPIADVVEEMDSYAAAGKDTLVYGWEKHFKEFMPERGIEPLVVDSFFFRPFWVWRWRK